MEIPLGNVINVYLKISHSTYIKAAEYAKTGKYRNRSENVSRAVKGRLRKGGYYGEE
jgi:hypothetical protein